MIVTVSVGPAFVEEILVVGGTTRSQCSMLVAYTFDATEVKWDGVGLKILGQLILGLGPGNTTHVFKQNISMEDIQLANIRNKR
jgi:hypothetical protein